MICSWYSFRDKTALLMAKLAIHGLNSILPRPGPSFQEEVLEQSALEKFWGGALFRGKKMGSWRSRVATRHGDFNMKFHSSSLEFHGIFFLGHRRYL